MFEPLLKLMANGFDDEDHPNTYYPVPAQRLLDAESRLGFSFPDQLRTFYLEVGYGFFKTAHPETERDGFSYVNRFLSPTMVADLLTGKDRAARPSEGFQKGNIPFFEIADRYYLVI